MKNYPLLSVIVPVYNMEQFLPRCMESLEKQTYGNLEIILIDDGSSDGSPVLCDMYAERLENVQVLHKKNAGLGCARNSGLDMARGQYIAFVDADDSVALDMYWKLMSEAITAEADAVLCDYRIVKHDGTQKTVESNLEEGIYSGMQILLGVLGADPKAKRDFDFDMSVCKGVYLRSFIETHKIRFVSERDIISEDLMFTIEFMRKAQIISYIKNSLYYYYENVGSLTHRYISNRLEKEKMMYETVKKKLGKDLDAMQWLRFDRLFLGRVRSSIVQEVKYTPNSCIAERLRAIRHIAEDHTVINVVKEYPLEQNPIKIRIFNICLRWKFCLGMYGLILFNR